MFVWDEYFGTCFLEYSPISFTVLSRVVVCLHLGRHRSSLCGCYQLLLSLTPLICKFQETALSTAVTIQHI